MSLAVVGWLRRESERVMATGNQADADILGWAADIVAERSAQAIEAGTAETGTGSVHESAVLAEDAPNSPGQSPSKYRLAQGESN